MFDDILNRKEKKVEYIELIYDLIFVYIIGRNNTLLHTIEGGFVSREMFIAYVMCTLAVIQIWTFTTYYINLYGRQSIRDHIFMFINMFMLYFIAEGTRENWQDYHTVYHIAWAVILVNAGLQYIIEMQNQRGEAIHLRRTRAMSIILFAEAALVTLSVFEFNRFSTSYLSLGAILFGIISVSLSSRNTCSGLIDFNHLSERVMLYVVFTFGEMIIAIATYFEGVNNLNNLYFCFMAFLIVVGLFLSYGLIYDHIIDRDMRTNGIGYILLHIFIVFSLNNITAGLEFMREEEVSLLPKILFLTVSIILYYVFLFACSRYSKSSCRIRNSFYLAMAVSAVAFAGLMLLFRENMYINIAITVIAVFSVFAVLYRTSHAKRE